PCLFDEVADRLADIDRLVERNADLDTGWYADHLRQSLAQRIHHPYGVGDGLFVHPQIHGSCPVGPDDVGLNVRRIGHGPDVPYAYGAALRFTFTITSWIGSTVRNWLLVKTL